MDAKGTIPAGRCVGDCYRFDSIVVDATAHTLSRNGELLAVEPKAFAVLLFLLRHSGELVHHGDLLDAVWGHRHVTPGVLTRAIAQLRHVLDDDSQHPRYIQTQHGLGYRFIGELLAQPAATAATPRATTDVSRSAATAAQPAGADLPAGSDNVGARTGQSLAARASSRRLWLPVALLATMAVAAWLWFRPGPLQQAPPAESSIVVLPFTSLGEGTDDDYFAEGLAAELRDALRGVPGLRVAACRAGSACGKRSADAGKLGRMVGAATVLDAELRREGQRVRVDARLLDSSTGVVRWSGSYDRELAGIFALQGEIAQDVVQSLLGVPLDQQGVQRRLTPTHNILAYDAYLRGVQQLRRADGEGDGSDAVSFFQQALAADPGFARAQAGICRAGIIGFERTHDAVAFEQAQTACQRAYEMDPHLQEVDLALGDLYRARDDNAQAIEHFRKALDAPALRPDAYVGLARAEAALGRNDVAVDYFERARRLRPGDPAIYSALGFHHYRQGGLREAIGSYRTAATLDPDDEEIWSSLGGLYMVSGDTARATDAYTRSLAIRPSYAALANLGTLRYEERNYAEAADLYRRASAVESDDYRVWGNLADALAASPATAAQARDPYRRAARMVQQYVDIKPSDAHAVAVLAWYRANLGQEQDARELIARAEALATEEGEVAFWSAQSLALLGDAAEARKRLARARAKGIPDRRLQASPLLQPLLETTKGEERQPAAASGR